MKERRTSTMSSKKYGKVMTTLALLICLILHIMDAMFAAENSSSRLGRRGMTFTLGGGVIRRAEQR